jgi:hypothetical protein
VKHFLCLKTCTKLRTVTSEQSKASFCSFLDFVISPNNLLITLNFVPFICVLLTAERGRGHAAPSGITGTGSLLPCAEQCLKDSLNTAFLGEDERMGLFILCA